MGKLTQTKLGSIYSYITSHFCRQRIILNLDLSLYIWYIEGTGVLSLVSMIIKKILSANLFTDSVKSCVTIYSDMNECCIQISSFLRRYSLFLC